MFAQQANLENTASYFLGHLAMSNDSFESNDLSVGKA